jgi:hypothetical protein
MLFLILQEFSLPESTCGIPHDAGVVKGFTGRTTREFHRIGADLRSDTRGPAQPGEVIHVQ